MVKSQRASNIASRIHGSARNRGQASPNRAGRRDPFQRAQGLLERVDDVKWLRSRFTKACRGSMRSPDGGGVEEPLDDPYLVGEEQAEAETQES
jgi:hypothetical protein